LNARKLFIALGATLFTMAMGLGEGTALGNQVPGVLVSGHIMAITGTEWIKVDGKNYRIRSGSPAAAAVGKMAPGQMVDLVLSGPATASLSEVTNVVLHSGP
jgi:hypothetical protein